MITPIRICFVIEDLLPAGTELWIIKLIQYIDRSRVEPFICLLNGAGEQSRSLEPDCEVLSLGMRKIRSLQGIRAAKRLRSFLKQHEIDIVQVHHADPTYFAIPIARLAGVKKLVQTKFDVGYWLSGTNLWLHRVYRRFVDVTVANCNACKQASIDQEWTRSNKVVVVNNGIPMERFAAIPDPVFHEPEIHVGMVCNLREIKDPFAYLHAAKQCVQSRPNLHFHLAGDGELMDPIASFLQDHQLSDRFQLHGMVTDIPRFLQALHIAVLCSKSEGLSHAILEYMAAGRATIVTDVGGNSELIQNEINGLLVPSRDASALADSIERLVDNPALAERLGKAARQSVAEKYSCESMARRFEDFYVGLVQSRQSDQKLQPSAKIN